MSRPSKLVLFDVLANGLSALGFIHFYFGRAMFFWAERSGLIRIRPSRAIPERERRGFSKTVGQVRGMGGFEFHKLTIRFAKFRVT
jgi:hypothetical protein